MAKLVEGDRFTALDLAQARLQRRERVCIGKDLGGLLQGLVLVDGDERRSGSSVPGYQHVVAALADVVEQAAQVAAKFTHWDGLGHRRSVHNFVRLTQKVRPLVGAAR